LNWFWFESFGRQLYVIPARAYEYEIVNCELLAIDVKVDREKMAIREPEIDCIAINMLDSRNDAPRFIG
jgi:hypothetical protein